MKIMVSACLLGQNCKYNGGNNYSEKVAQFTKGHEVIPVCPEVAGGLETPRIPCEIVNGIVTNKNGESKDKEFRTGAQLSLQKALDEDVDIDKLTIQKEELDSVEWFDLEEVYQACQPPRDEKFCVPMGGLEIVRSYFFIIDENGEKYGY